MSGIRDAPSNATLFVLAEWAGAHVYDQYIYYTGMGAHDTHVHTKTQFLDIMASIPGAPSDITAMDWAGASWIWQRSFFDKPLVHN